MTIKKTAEMMLQKEPEGSPLKARPHSLIVRYFLPLHLFLLFTSLQCFGGNEDECKGKGGEYDKACEQEAPIATPLPLPYNVHSEVGYFNLKTDEGMAQIFFDSSMKIEDVLKGSAVQGYIKSAIGAHIEVESDNCVSRAYQFGHQLLKQNALDDVGKIVIYENSDRSKIPECWGTQATDTGAIHHALCYAVPRGSAVHMAFDHGVRVNRDGRQTQIYIGKTPEKLEEIIKKRYFAKTMGLVNVSQDIDDARSGKYPLTSNNQNPTNASTDKEHLGKTPMHFPASTGNLERVEELAKSHPESLSAKNEMGMTPLEMALMGRNLEIVKFLLKKDPKSLHVNDQFGRTPLIQAMSHSKFDFVKYLIQSYPETLNDLDKNGNGLLHTAISEWSMLEYLDKTGPKIIDMLVQKKINVNLQNTVGNTALHDAVSAGNVEAVNFLLRSGADAKLKNKEGKTLKKLRHLLKSKHFLVLKKLIDKLGNW